VVRSRFPNFYVCHESEERSTPVGGSPGSLASDPIPLKVSLPECQRS
jgi:hypothetical protein